MCTAKTKFLGQSIQKLQPKHNIQKYVFSFCDLDPDPMTLIYKYDRDILKMYLYTKIEFYGQGFQMLEPEEDKRSQIDTRWDTKWCHICGR